MDLLQRQSYKLWFNWLGHKIKEWHELKPKNTELINCVKAINEIGVFNYSLQTEVDVLTKKLSLVRQEKNEIIEQLREQIKQLTNEDKTIR